MNPFGIGPAGAIFLTCFIATIVALCVSIMSHTTITVTRDICTTVVSVWHVIQDIAEKWLASKTGKP